MKWIDLVNYIIRFAEQFNKLGFNKIQRSDWNGNLPLLSYNIIPNDDGNGIYENGVMYHKAKIEFLIIEDVKTIDKSTPIDRAMIKAGAIQESLIKDERITIMKIYEQMAFDYKQGKMLDKTILTLECEAIYTI